jgi:hypothetical protein
VSDVLPDQVCTWLPERSGFEAEPEREEASDGQWLYCLKYTEPGDRQIVWQGSRGDGIVALVDFNGEVRRRRHPEGGRPMDKYEGWGRITSLRVSIPVEEVRAHPALAGLFGGPIQSVTGLTDEEAGAIVELVEGLPPAPEFEEGETDHGEEGGKWGPRTLPREVITEEIVLNRARIAKRLGFPSPVNPGARKKRLGNGRYPDVWCADGVVGEVKNQVTADWGPGQIEDYIRQCDEEWPEFEWKGVLVQGEEEMAPNAERRLEASPYIDRIEVFSVREARPGRVEVEWLFSEG